MKAFQLVGVGELHAKNKNIHFPVAHRGSREDLDLGTCTCTYIFLIYSSCETKFITKWFFTRDETSREMRKKRKKRKEEKERKKSREMRLL